MWESALWYVCCRSRREGLSSALTFPMFRSAAPELAKTDPYAGEPVDMWSAGILLFTLLVGSE